MTLQDIVRVFRSAIRQAESPRSWRVTVNGKRAPDALLAIRLVGSALTLTVAQRGATRRIEVNLLDNRKAVLLDRQPAPAATFRVSLRHQLLRPLILILEIRGIGAPEIDRIRLETPS